MNEEKIQDFRERVQPQIRDYLKAAHIKVSEDGVTTVCPICGDIAGLMKDDTWLCMHCGKRGDLLDYVLCGHPSMKISGAMRHIQRTLGETILELDAVNANDLMEMIGKSWLVLWLADRVSKGEKVWDFQTSPCEVLYVSLEDTEQRIQQRLGEVTGGEADKIWIATEAELLGKGFEQQIGNFLTAHPNVGFVIVDTLQRIRQMKTEGYSYGGDYEVMTSLKTIADRFNITILVVHHTRKEDSDDSFNKISGTNGLLGCADGAMVLQKPSRIGREATLDITGREVADLRLKLEFDESKRWQFIEYGTDSADESSNKLLAAVQKLVSECHRWQGTPTELLGALTSVVPPNTKPNALTRQLNTSVQTLAQQYGIQYDFSRTMDARMITLSELPS